LKVITIIPVYKKTDDLNKYELSSISNTCNKLNGKCVVSLIGPKKLKDSYMDLYPMISYIVFPSIFFKSINGYNKLLLSISFYKRFKNYQYILIVQTDAWIFGIFEHLNQFKCFDFSGAPSINNKKNHGFNGGLSLRNVESAIKALKHTGNYESLKEIFNRHWNSSKIFEFLLYKWFSILVDYLFRRKIFYPLNYFYSGNEDIFWSVEVPRAFKDFKVIDFESSLGFSWENDCQYFSKTMPLPFGCHGWWNYNSEFWIENEIISLPTDSNLNSL
jgi:hypothetical protein